MRRIYRVFLLLLLFSITGIINPGHAQDVQILVLEWVEPGVKELEDEYPTLEIIPVEDTDDMIREAGNADAIIGWVNEDVISAAGQLKWVQSPSAGVRGFVTIPALVERDIVLTNSKIIMGPEIADHAFALLLSLTRNIKQFHNQMASGSWERDEGMPLMELRNKTILIIGLGGIGIQVAERAAASGMRGLAGDTKDIPFMEDVEYVGKPDELDTLLPEADVIVSAVPHTDRSAKMLGSDQFALMKDGVYIVNVSRGAIIDTDALMASLRSGKVAGAGLDVTDPEPLPSDHPLWDMPQVLITPHVAGRSDGLDERRLGLFRENIRRFMEGLPLKNQVNKQAGY